MLRFALLAAALLLATTAETSLAQAPADTSGDASSAEAAQSMQTFDSGTAYDGYFIPPRKSEIKGQN